MSATLSGDRAEDVLDLLSKIKVAETREVELLDLIRELRASLESACRLLSSEPQQFAGYLKSLKY